MPDIQRDIESHKNYNDFIGTPSHFAMFYKYGVRGLSDIDQFYEKKSEFIFTEGKNLTGDTLDVPLGQFIGFDHLQQKLGSKSTVLFVGYKPKSFNEKLYWITTVNQAKQEFTDIQKQTKSGLMNYRCIKLSNLRGPCSEEQYCKFMKKLCDDLE